jgi:rhodanese-related sulfurtransferase
MLGELYSVFDGKCHRQTPEIRMTEAKTKHTKTIGRQSYAAGAKRMTSQLVKLFMISSLIAFFYGQLHAAELSNDPLPTVQENVAIHKAVLVDVREPGEWTDGHIKGAISLPLSSLEKSVDTKTLEQELPKDKIVYTHCVVGVRALKAAKILEKFGYNVRPLKVGYENLVKAGFEKAAN